MSDPKTKILFDKVNSALKEANLSHADTLAFLSTFSACVISATATSIGADWEDLADKFYECLYDTCGNIEETDNPNVN